MTNDLKAREPEAVLGSGFDPENGGFAYILLGKRRFTAAQVRAALSPAQPADLAERLREIESIAKQAEVYAVGKRPRLDPGERFAAVAELARNLIAAIYPQTNDTRDLAERMAAVAENATNEGD